MRLTAGRMAIVATLLGAAASPAVAKDHVRGMVLYKDSVGACVHLGAGGGYTMHKNGDRAVWVIDNKSATGLGPPCGKAQMAAVCVYNEEGALDGSVFQRCKPPTGPNLNVPFRVEAGQQVKLHCEAAKQNIIVDVVAHSGDTAQCSTSFTEESKAEESKGEEAKGRFGPRHHVIGIQILP